jgi:hypothetical protein
VTDDKSSTRVNIDDSATPGVSAARSVDTAEDSQAATLHMLQDHNKDLRCVGSQFGEGSQECQYVTAAVQEAQEGNHDP